MLTNEQVCNYSLNDNNDNDDDDDDDDDDDAINLQVIQRQALISSLQPTHELTHTHTHTQRHSSASV